MGLPLWVEKVESDLPSEKKAAEARSPIRRSLRRRAADRSTLRELGRHEVARRVGLPTGEPDRSSITSDAARFRRYIAGRQVQSTGPAIPDLLEDRESERDLISRESRARRARLNRNRDSTTTTAVDVRFTTGLRNVPREPLGFDGLGDRNRSLSPEGVGAWDTLLTTLTPDPQPPSLGSSFASTAASQSAAPSTSTSFTEPNFAPGAPDAGCESHSDNDDEGDDEEVDLLDEIEYWNSRRRPGMPPPRPRMSALEARLRDSQRQAERNGRLENEVSTTSGSGDNLVSDYGRAVRHTAPLPAPPVHWRDILTANYGNDSNTNGNSNSEGSRSRSNIPPVDESLVADGSNNTYGAAVDSQNLMHMIRFYAMETDRLDMNDPFWAGIRQLARSVDIPESFWATLAPPRHVNPIHGPPGASLEGTRRSLESNGMPSPGR